MTYSDAIRFLYDLRWFGAKLGLENTFKLAELSGNPQRRLSFIHVAGTNGKGSVCAMLESIYRAAGRRVGLFTSPHLVSFRERIQVNREWISAGEVVRQAQAAAERLKHFPEGHSPTFFEVVTVMALCHFAEQGCDLVVWETGLGGRLDATNIVTPLASVITNIQYDHQEWLGETLPSIAAEKAGIIKPGLPVITAADEPHALTVLQQSALRQGSPLTLVTPSDTRHPPLDTVQLPLSGWHQQLNAAVAIATVRALERQIPVSDAALRRGLSLVSWSGRMQMAQLRSGRRILLDGAHNSGGATSLRAAIQELFPGERLTFILGILEDKDWDLMCKILAPLAERVVCVPVNTERTAVPLNLREACQDANPAAHVTVGDSLAAALAVTESDPFVVIAGSLYLVGEAIELLGLAPEADGNERTLNEWGAARHPAQEAVQPAR